MGSREVETAIEIETDSSAVLFGALSELKLDPARMAQLWQSAENEFADGASVLGW
jgi:hypothetical protein